MPSVKLYVYDLSNGMARQMSRQLTGRQIDGIWHTSVVVFGKEVFYGQGISITAPGRSHHGQPLQVIDMGETALDEETFTEYLAEMRQHYTADKYHLLEFNCNSFTDDCVGFLTGKSIPSSIKDLPTDFLSTPFGAALRPTIDAMYRRPAAGAPAAPPPATSMSQDQVANSLTSPLHVITNPASFHGFLKSHRAAVAFFTSETCPPCKMIEPVFERLSEEKGMREGIDGAGFAKIDIDVGMGRNLASEWGIRATPTFMFFLDGKKLDELKGANANELRTQVDLLLFQAYPPHPHAGISLPAIQALSLNPILFSQVPAIDTTKGQVKNLLKATVAPYLKSRFPSPAPTSPATLPSASPTILAPWAQATVTVISCLPVDSLFPMVDMWRLAFLDPAVGTWAAAMLANAPNSSPMIAFLNKSVLALDSPSKGARNFILTILRMLCNAFSSPTLGPQLLRGPVRDQITAVLVPSLLHSDATVRTAAASLSFNVAAVPQKARVEAVRTGKGIKSDSEDDLGDWQVEMISAVIEAIEREKDSEEVVHRLTASLAFFIRLSPHYGSSLKSLLEVLQSQTVLKSKLTKGEGWNADGGVDKKEVRKLIEEVANKLCA
ncbi:PPPDE putative peptidase domain-containing protein [Panaeolus papilionaceus]|nr:PPPDE putative peptidase domain-containing protein [Panaeolus papilionaceus]